MSDLGTFVTEYFVTAPTDEPGITATLRRALHQGGWFGEAREIERLTIGGATGSAVSVIGQLCDGEVRPEPVAYAP